jgi:twitching motility protein PilT
VHEMQTFNQSLADLVIRNVITMETAVSASSEPGELRTIVESGKGLNRKAR